jgi:hypothetical protein
MMMLMSMPKRIPSNPSALMLMYFIATSKTCRCVGVDPRSADAFCTRRAKQEFRLEAGRWRQKSSRQDAKAAKQDKQRWILAKEYKLLLALRAWRLGESAFDSVERR